MESTENAWMLKESKSTCLERMFNTFSTLWCLKPKQERCLRCLETVRPVEGMLNRRCDTEELHMTCACFLAGDYFRADSNLTYLWRETPEKNLELFIDNVCCFRAAAIVILPSSALEDINASMHMKICDCNNIMTTCNRSCCGPSSPCMKVLFQLCDEYQFQGLSLSTDQFNAFQVMVNSPGRFNKLR